MALTVLCVPNSFDSGYPYSRNGKRLRGGFVFQTHRLVYHPTLGLRVIKKKRRLPVGVEDALRDHPSEGVVTV